MSDTNKLAAAVRTEFGKGAARRARREGLVPAVLYGHGSEPRHLTVKALEFAAILRKDGTNAVLHLDIEGTEQIALTKQVVVHPLRNYIEHADLLVIKKGEKVVVTVNVVLEGVAAPGTQIQQDVQTIDIEADALNIPENIVVSIQDLGVGTRITAAEVELPAGVTIVSSPDDLVVDITEILDADEGDNDEADEAESAPAAESAE